MTAPAGDATPTTDPLVAVFYVAGVHPSLHAGLAAAIDIVAGQPGPWNLTDTDRAAACEQLVARLTGPAIAGAAAGTIHHLAQARQALAQLDDDPTVSAHLRHAANSIEERIERFLTERTVDLQTLATIREHRQ